MLLSIDKGSLMLKLAGVEMTEKKDLQELVIDGLFWCFDGHQKTSPNQRIFLRSSLSGRPPPLVRAL